MSHICVGKYLQREEGPARGGGLVQRVQRMYALAGVRVQKVQKVQKVQRVLVAPCGRNIKKTFTTGLSPGENRQTALRAKEKRSPLPASCDTLHTVAKVVP